MSSRTARASRAVREAWRNEQRLVLEGEGTRDWTDEQQKQIKEIGKACDDEGKTFEGQHMKSVETYPEYQDDPRNIQFLTREEHFAAHGGNWMNQTNGYYDPVSSTLTDFGIGPPQPCAERALTNPIYAEPVNASGTQTPGNESQSSDPLAGAAVTDPIGKLRQRTRLLGRLVRQALKDPRVEAAAASLAAGAVKAAVDRAGSTRGSRVSAPRISSSTDTPSGPDPESSKGVRQSPGAHGVSGHTRKDGTYVRPYQRGGNRD